MDNLYNKVFSAFTNYINSPLDKFKPSNSPENWTIPCVNIPLYPSNTKKIIKEDISIECTHILSNKNIRIARYTDIMVGFKIGSNDKNTCIELKFNDHFICRTQLNAGEINIAFINKYIIPLALLQYTEVTISFIGPIPKELYYIGAKINDEKLFYIFKNYSDIIIKPTSADNGLIITTGLGAPILQTDFDKLDLNKFNILKEYEFIK